MRKKRFPISSKDKDKDKEKEKESDTASEKKKNRKNLRFNLGDTRTPHQRIHNKAAVIEAIARHNQVPVEVSPSYRRLHRFAGIIHSRYDHVHKQECERLCGLAKDAMDEAGLHRVIKNGDCHELQFKNGKTFHTKGIETGLNPQLMEK